MALHHGPDPHLLFLGANVRVAGCTLVSQTHYFRRRRGVDTERLGTAARIGPN